MLTHEEIKRLANLRKARDIRQEGLFLAAGEKLVNTLIENGMHPVRLLTNSPKLAEKLPAENTYMLNSKQLQRISTLDSPTSLIAVFEVPEKKPLPLDGRRTLILEEVQDPGNLGSIIRTADWCGFDQVLCSYDSAFLYSPKSIQATMGAAARMHVAYCDIVEILRNAPQHLPRIATSLAGQDCRTFHFPAAFALLLGNEGRGLRNETIAQTTNQITIPHPGTPAADSLNVAAAAAILCYQSTIRQT